MNNSFNTVFVLLQALVSTKAKEMLVLSLDATLLSRLTSAHYAYQPVELTRDRSLVLAVAQSSCIVQKHTRLQIN